MKSHFVLGICVSLLLGAPLIAANANEAAGTVVSGTENPRIAITSHADGDQVSSSEPVIVMVAASDDSGIQKVSLFTKGDQDAKFKWHGAITSEPYEWNLGILPAGTYMLLAKAVAGNNSEAKLIIPVEVFGSPVNAPPSAAAHPSTAGGIDTRDDMNSIKPVPKADNTSVQETAGTEQPVFIEKDGLVVIEAEGVALPAGWEERSSIDGYMGNGYMVYVGRGYNKEPGGVIVRYPFRISTTGTYEFAWRSRNGEGAVEGDKENDSR
ncbi:Ig-like domain-containing protein [Planctomycetota bacterium]